MSERGMLQAALSYAAKGFPVFQLHWVESGQCSCGNAECKHPGKHPFGPTAPNGFKNATTDAQTVNEWWREHPACNIGIATGKESGIVVLDVDPRHGGNDSLARLESQYGPMPGTTEAQTGGNGSHLWFKHPGGKIGCKSGMAPGLDLKADGGYVVAPPSLHIDGVYDWKNRPDEVKPADLPSWLFTLATAVVSAPTTPVERRIGEGRRNDTLTREAGRLRRSGLDADAILPTLLQFNSEHCVPPLPVEEVESIARSVERYAPATTGVDGVPGDPVPELAVWTWSALLQREFTPPEFVVEGVIPRRGVTLLTGEGGIGKSFMLIDLAYSVASGSRFLSHFECAKGPVLLVDLENDEDTIARRARKIATGRQESEEVADDIPVYIVKKGEAAYTQLRLDDERGAEALRRAVESYRPTLLLIDPLVALHGEDENDNMKMRRVVMQLQEIARNYNLAVVVVHHPRKRGMANNDPGQMIRGASDLRNAVDSHLFIRKASKEQLIAEHDKSRHSPPLPKFTVEMVDNDSETATYLRYTGESSESLEKEAAARECILAILHEQGQCQRKELIARAESENVRKSTAERALSKLVKERTVTSPERGRYLLAGRQSELDMEDIAS